MIDIGHFFLFIGWFFALISILCGYRSAHILSDRLSQTAKNALLIMALSSVFSLLCLAYQFVTHDYSNLYVWQHSSNEMKPYYLVSAIWGGMDGSMLLWAVIMTIFAFASTRSSEFLPKKLILYVIPTLAFASFFFLSVVLFLTNPFRLVPTDKIQLNGNGLNPLLQNPSMMIHPPMLYLGFTGFVVPFAYCIAALLSGELDSSWIRAVRKWTLISWTFLTAGIILGGNWAYIELGWGGFWAWDPVENASFLPWLTGTAFLHSVMVQEHRGMLKKWNVFLASLTYLLTVFGTFLTRSGVVQSVHAFAETDVGWVFLFYLAVMSLIIIALVIYRRKDLSSENVIVSYLSRESAFLFNNLALLGICFVTLWGVMLPVFSEALGYEKMVVGPPFFNRVNNPLFLVLLFLMATGPLIAWRKTSLSQIKKVFLRPFVFASFVSVFLILIDSSRVLSAISFGLSFFVVITIFGEFYKSVRNRKLVLQSETAITHARNLFNSKRRKYGAHIIHLGVALCAVSITASSAYKVERDISLKKGESIEVGRYKLALDSIVEGKEKAYGFLRTTVSVYSRNSGELITRLFPEKRVYGRNQEVTTEVDIHTTGLEDLYLALGGLENSSQENQSGVDSVTAVFKLFINPLQVWLWISSILMLSGAAILLLEKRVSHSALSRESIPLATERI